MKKVSKYITYGVLLGAVAIFAYAIAHSLGTAERGYEAIGGEIFVPFLVIFGKDIWKALFVPMKATK